MKNMLKMFWSLVSIFVLLANTHDGRSINVRKDSSMNKNCWDFFILMQRWPYSSCQIVNASGTPCTIPSNIDTWTLHGLWPDNINTYPSFCTTEAFNFTVVEDLKEELLLKWPNLYAEESEDSLWKHEYEKHGTCAEDLEAFTQQRDYFKNTMKYFDQYDVTKVLADAGIYPQEEPFQTKTLLNAIQNGYDVVVCPWCGHIKDFGQVISQLGICIDKNNTVVNCPSCAKKCRMDVPTYYQPNHPQRHNDKEMSLNAV